MIFRLNYGDDIAEAIIEKCKGKKITSGAVFFIGAVQKAVLGYYDQKKKKYKRIIMNKPMEIVAGMGNISSKDNNLFLHAHITLSDEKGRVFGGHLFSPTVVFICEVYMVKKKVKLVRGFDKTTRLFLWQ